MSEISPINQPNSPLPTPAMRSGRHNPITMRPIRGHDRVELSQSAQFLSRIAQLPDVRQGLIDRVRGQIDKGTYDTPDKVDALIDQLYRDLV